MSESKILTDLILAKACERMRNEALDVVAGHDDYLYDKIAALPDVSLDMLDLPDGLLHTATGPDKIDLYLDLAFMLLIGMAIGLACILIF